MDDKIKMDLSVSDETTETKKKFTNKFTGELKKPPTLIEIADDGTMPF